MRIDLARRAAAECLGSALLLAIVVGSGIMGERLSNGSVGLALLANTLATGAGLVALILMLGPVSGAHFNPAVTLAEASQGALAWRDVPGYLLAQVLGAFAGTASAHVMFGERLFSASTHVRAGGAQLFSEFVATFGLLSVIQGCARTRASAVPFAVGSYITAAYWFTASTSFANPAVTFARAASNTFAGIRPADAPGFVAVQLLGALSATLLFRWLVPAPARQAQGEIHLETPVAIALFACVHNAGRSQMAAAWLNHLAPGSRARAISAGTEPGTRVHPEVVAVMQEVGIDLQAGKPQFLSEQLARSASLLVTMGCGEACPVIPGLQREDWPLEDPKGKPLERVREIRDEIRRRVVELLARWPVAVQPAEATRAR